MALPLFGAGAGLVGTAVLGGEVLALSSIVFLGKEGFKAIKAKIFGAVKASYTAPVGRARHYLGIVLLLTNALTTWIVAIYAGAAFSAITPENPIYVLGADWWGRFRSIFVWQETKT